MPRRSRNYAPRSSEGPVICGWCAGAPSSEDAAWAHARCDRMPSKIRCDCRAGGHELSSPILRKMAAYCSKSVEACEAAHRKIVRKALQFPARQDDDMDMTTTQTQLAEAIARRAEARWLFTTSTFGTKAWRDAEENLNYWQGKVVALDAASCREVREGRA